MSITIKTRFSISGKYLFEFADRYCLHELYLNIFIFHLPGDNKPQDTSGNDKYSTDYEW